MEDYHVIAALSNKKALRNFKILTTFYYKKEPLKHELRS